MSKRKTIEKRFVDYVFLAGLPSDFRINPKEQELKNRSSSLKDKREQSISEEYEFNSIEKEIKAKEKKTRRSINIMKDIDTSLLNIDTSITNVANTLILPNVVTSETKITSVKSDNKDVSRKLINNHNSDLVADDEESKKLFDSLFENIKTNILKFDQERDEFLNSIGKGLSISSNKSFNFEDLNNINKDDDYEVESASIQDELLETDSILSFSSNNNNKENARSSYQNVVPQQPSSKRNDDIKPDTLIHPLKQKFPPKLLSRYPKDDYPKEGAFPAYVPMFCFPNDIMIRESDICPTTTFHGFVMTQEDGSQRHGVCLTTFEPIPDDLFEELNEQQKTWREVNMTPSEIEYAEHLSEKIRTERRRLETARAKISLQGQIISSREFQEIEKETIDAKEKLSLYNELLQPIKLGVLDKSSLWVPRCIGILSHLPWHDVLKDWLCAVVMPMIEGLKESNDPTKSLIPLERHIVNIIHEVPLPPPGKLQIAISVNDMTLFCARPALNQMPIMKDFSLYPLFRSLSINNIVTLFEVALAEKKILIISSYPDMLYMVARSITCLIYPLYWQGVFIPILPARLMACLQAPVPYIMGIERQYKGMDLLPEDACIIDVDKNTILMAEPPIQIPPRQRKKLIQSLEACSPLHTRHEVPLGVPTFVQEAYPNGRFTPTSNKSKMYDKAMGGKVGSVVGMPAKAIPLALSISSSFDPENGLMKTSGNGEIDQAFYLAPVRKNYNDFNNDNFNSYNSNRSSNNSSSSSISDIFSSYGSTLTANTASTANTSKTSRTANTKTHKYVRTSVSLSNIYLSSNNSLNDSPQKRFSNLVPPFSSNKFDNIKSLDKFGKTIQRFSTITGGARNSIMTFKSKALTKSNVFSIKLNGGDSFSRSTDAINSSMISAPTSPNSTNYSGSFFDDVSSTVCSEKSYNRLSPGINSEKEYLPKEGHLMVLLPPDMEAYGQKSGIDTWIMEGLACGICRNSLGINPTYKCEGCSIMIHDECLNDMVYPCIPSCFDESKVLEAFLRVFASLLRNYRHFLANYNNTRCSDILEDEFDAAEDANAPFKKDSFLKSVDKDEKAFLSSLVDSQSFSQFINDRTTRESEDYDIRYFDEVIKAKLNRSKLRFSKESTNFLDDSSFDISQTVRAMKSNEEGLDELGFEGYVCLPDCFDTELMSTPRPVRDGWANGFGKGWR